MTASVGSGAGPVFDGDRRYFFIHVMKTGGTTFRWMHIRSNFSKDDIYPDPDQLVDSKEAYFLVPTLLSLSEERRHRIRIYSGHFPFVAARLLDPTLVTITLLRDPVERTISHLKHCKRYHAQHRDLSLEAIYEDAFYQPTVFRDHQVKMFAMTPHDKLESHMDVIEIDRPRLELAQANLEAVDVVGLNDDLEGFLGELESRFGWRVRERPRHRVSEEPWEASSELRRRIAQDSAMDVEFYEFARSLVEARRG